MVNTEKEALINKAWNDYWIQQDHSDIVKELKSYFLEENTAVPIVKKIDDYVYRLIIWEMINVSPLKVITLLFEDENFKLRKEPFSEIEKYLLENTFEIEKEYSDKFFIILKKISSNSTFKILSKFYLKDKEKYQEEILQAYSLVLDKLKSSYNLETVCLEYYELFKEHLSKELFLKKQFSFLKKMLFKKEIPYYNHELVEIYLLKELDKILAEEEFFDLLKEYLASQEMTKGIFSYLNERFAKRSNELFEHFFSSKEPKVRHTELKNLYVELEKLDFESYFDKVWKFTEENLSLGTLNYAIKALLRYEDKLPVNHLFAQIILLSSLKKSTEKKVIEQFQKEPNDKKNREVLLPMISSKIYGVDMELKEVNKVIAFAKKRGKLEKWKEPFELKDLPKLYLNNGKKLTADQVHFLFYRMGLITTMQTDIEAKILLNHIDKSKGETFAKFILEAFLANGSKAPQKYLMAMAGIFGDDRLIEQLKKLFNEVFEAKRMKMAQYVIGTLALIGTDKALRFIEFVGRKHKKKQALHEFCLASLDIAAKELGISSDELSEKIIPDFGFDGLYRSIELDGEEFRVFVAKDFKLQYINEENKIRKSLPKTAPKELKAELKTVQAEIRDVNKAGAGRLEQYMVKERRWDVDAWQKFYLFNPVMFIYASTLVWGLYDKENKLKELFYIDEDSSMMNIDDDEIELEDHDQIGMVHPLRLAKEQIKAWKEHFYDLDIVQPFKQLDRESYLFENEESIGKALNQFNDKTPSKGSGAIKTILDKRGYRKEVWDAGSVEFYKEFKSLDIRVDVGVYGINVVYYEGEEVYISETKFRRISGEYNNKMNLNEIPDMILSETILDMELVMGT